MSDPIEDAARAFLSGAPMFGSSQPAGVDVLLERAAKFQAILREAGNAPIAEAAMLCGLLRLMLPDIDEATLARAEADIRRHVGLDD